MAREKVYSVEAVRLSLQKKIPAALVIAAKGQARTSGWSNSALELIMGPLPPEDGIWQYEFVAEKPGRIVPDVLTPIEATAVLDPVPPELRGVEVHAGSNSKKAML